MMPMQTTLFPTEPNDVHVDLTFDQSLPESARAGEPDSGVSPSYGFIGTKQILEALFAMGFTLRRAVAQKGSRTGKHVVTLEHPGIRVEQNDPSEPTTWEAGVVITNAHNGQARYVATLTLTSGDGAEFALGAAWSTVRVRHNRLIAREAPRATLALIDAAPRIGATLEHFELCTVNQQELAELAARALRSRWGARAPLTVTAVVGQISARRLIDALSQIQTAVLDGGVRTTRGRVTRRLRQPSERVRIQRSLWAECEHFAEHGAFRRSEAK